MKTKSKLNLASSFLAISLFLIFSTSCNKDDGEKISAEQIRQALFDMKGRYHGAIEASFYQGTKIIKIENVEAISRDSLTFIMPLEPITSTITDEKVVDFLRNINTVEIKAGYNFYQIDEYIDDNENINFFTLAPQKVIIFSKGNVPDVTIVFADSFGGSFEKRFNSIIFNISPKEIWIGSTKLDSFKQLVYHFEGKYE